MGKATKSSKETAKCATEIASIMKLLASPSRLRIAFLIRERALSVGEIATRAHCSQSQTSQLLGQLLIRGMVTRTQKERYHTYRLANLKLIRTVELIERNLLNQPKQRKTL